MERIASFSLAAELKFAVNRPLAEEIRQWARLQLPPDPHGGGEHGDCYTITSLYFDTPEFAVLNRTGSFARGKYRIRRYGADELVFLERKLKSRGLVGKRRTEVNLAELERVAASEPDRHWPGYWYHRRILVRRLQPVCQITYSRTARVGATASGPIRLTLDDDIATSAVTGVHFQACSEPALISNGHVILELKYRQRLPPLFERLIADFALTPQPSSKYRTAGAVLGFRKELCPIS